MLELIHLKYICMIYLPISFRVTSLALGQSYCPSASEVTLKDMGKIDNINPQPNTIWLHIMCIIIGMYSVANGALYYPMNYNPLLGLKK